ncbi:ribosome-associated heat shock protein Hsp15 [Catenovulum sp. SM1970]|uniref:ribosome-associated heat shock protein Hsp15 n=1 Tax=Marinifaba aquimaris TaxID=2741323 RepID=UPI001574A64B|nr:ribosome-associated heat shock protein Hsp15 [Marinifaba aquimaris]NTS75833.1 ribosome-associated heat shock protein Hsp15 [Marinifaba aquimaris]
MGKVTNSKEKSQSTEAVRLDKWLWAARFYKTRSLASEMIKGGKVKYNGQRIKPSRTVEVGAVITMQAGFDEKEVNVLGIAEKRKAAPEAQKLYQETEQSLAKREQRALERKAAVNINPRPLSRPDKKQRRQLIQVKHQLDNE